MKTVVLIFLQTQSKTWNQKITSMQKENKQLKGEVKALPGVNRVSKWNIREYEIRHDGKETKTRNW